MSLGTLEDFISQHQSKGRWSSNAYVDAPGFSQLYVRMGRRLLGGEVYQNVIDIANVEAEEPGNGAFTKLVVDLHSRGFNLYVESVLNPRFAEKLLRMGFTQLQGYEGAPCFYLLSEG